MKSGHYQPGKHCFAFLMVRDASVWFAGQESRLNRQRRFNRGENTEDHLSLVAAIKAAYLEMTSARTPAHRERVNRAFFFPFFLPLFPFLSKGNPRQTARDAESCRLANSKQLTKGQPDLQLSHKIKSMQPPVLCKHPLWLFITK